MFQGTDGFPKVSVNVQGPYPFQEGSGAASEEDLSSASRGQVFSACVQTSLVLIAFAFLLRAKASTMGAALLHTDSAQVERLLACTIRPFPFQNDLLFECGCKGAMHMRKGLTACMPTKVYAVYQSLITWSSAILRFCWALLHWSAVHACSSCKSGQHLHKPLTDPTSRF